MKLEDFNYHRFILRLNPTKDQISKIIEYGELMSRVHLWLHECILEPSHKRYVERTYKFCIATFKAAVETEDNKTISVEDKEKIVSYGYEGFSNLFKMGAYEHSKLPFKYERPNNWVLLNNEGKLCTFLNAQKSDIGPTIDMGDNRYGFITSEFGEIPIYPTWTNHFINTLNKISDSKFFIYPQVIFDKDTSECYLRSVAVSPISDKNTSVSINKCPYIYVPDWFFSDYAGFLYWPVFE